VFFIEIVNGLGCSCEIYVVVTLFYYCDCKCV